MNTLDFGEQRLLLRARRGEAVAVAALWAQVVDDLWSIASAVLPEEDAVGVLVELRTGLTHDLRGARVGEPWRALIFGRLWAILWQELVLPPFSGADLGMRWPSTEGLPLSSKPLSGADIKSNLRDAVASAPMELRVFYFFDLLSGCSIRELSAFAGASEARIRRVRSLLSLYLVRAIRS